MKGGKKMPYVIITALWPSDKSDETAKMFFEVMKKYPPDDSLGTPVVPAAFNSTLQGIKAITITEAKKGKLEDLLIRVGNVLAMYRNIQGYEAQVETYSTLEEALGSIGLSLPA
jgi:hypothetical protein